MSTTTDTKDLPAQAAPQPSTLPSLPPLSMEERNDLRRRVLQGYRLSIEESRRVFETLRTGQGAAVIAGEEKKSKKKAGKGMSDAELSKDLDSALGL